MAGYKNSAYQYETSPRKLDPDYDRSNKKNKTKLKNTLQNIIQKNFPNLTKQTNIQIQKIQKTPQKYSSKKTTPKHIIIKFTKIKIKKKILKTTKKKNQITHKKKPIKLTTNLSTKTLQTKKK